VRSAEKPRQRRVAVLASSRVSVGVAVSSVTPTAIRSQYTLIVVTMRTIVASRGRMLVRSTGTVCGRPTGKPMSSTTVRQRPDPSGTCSIGGTMRKSRWCAATLSPENA
jgi:hypothetical protein